MQSAVGLVAKGLTFSLPDACNLQWCVYKTGIAMCRFFPSVHYLASSKVAIATFGNLAFATALCLYHLVTRV